MLDEIHVANRVGHVGVPVDAGDVRIVEVAALGVEVQKSAAGAPDVACHSGQHRHRSSDVAARRLALQALPDPEQRPSGPIKARGLLDQRRRNAGLLLRPDRRALHC